jgi:hypothetical protein
MLLPALIREGICSRRCTTGGAYIVQFLVSAGMGEVAAAGMREPGMALYCFPMNIRITVCD